MYGSLELAPFDGGLDTLERLGAIIGSGPPLTAG
jgi:hypothetical protein